MNGISIEKEVKTVFRPSVIFAVGYILFNFLYLLSSIIIAKILGTHVFGLYSLGWAVTGIGSIIAGVGLNNVPSKFIPAYLHEGNNSKVHHFILFLFKVQLLSVLLVAAVLILSSHLISNKLYREPGLAIFIILLSGLIPFQKFIELIGSIFRGFKKLNYSVYLQNFFEPLYRFIFILAVFFLGTYLNGVFFVLYSGVTLTLLISLLTLKRKIISPLLQNRETPFALSKREVLLYTFPLLGVSIVSYLTGKTDILMIGYFLSPDKVGIYNIAFKLSIVVSLSLLSINAILAPVISELHVKKETKKLEASYKAFTRIALYASVFVFSSFIILAKPLLLFINKDFVLGFIPLVILSAGQIINVALGPGGNVLAMTNYPRLNLYNSASALVCNIVLNLFLIPRLGIIGAAIATSSSVVLLNLLRVLEVYFILKIHPFSFSYFKPLLAGGISLFLAEIIAYLTPNTSFIVIFISFTGAYLVLALLLGFQKEEKYMLDLVRSFRLKS